MSIKNHLFSLFRYLLSFELAAVCPRHFTQSVLHSIVSSNVSKFIGVKAHQIMWNFFYFYTVHCPVSDGISIYHNIRRLRTQWQNSEMAKWQYQFNKILIKRMNENTQKISAHHTVYSNILHKKAKHIIRKNFQFIVCFQKGHKSQVVNVLIAFIIYFPCRLILSQTTDGGWRMKNGAA